MPRPAQAQPAYILHRRAFRETSAIVELLTRDFGRVSGVVRGAKGGRRHRQDIEPFAEVAVTWRGTGQLVTVLRCETATPRRLCGHSLFAGLYINELLVKTLGHEEPVTPLFHDYGEALTQLAADQALEPTLRNFERRLLEELGYGLAFDVDVRTGRSIEAANTYGVVDGEGFRMLDRVGDPAALVLTGKQIAALDAGDYREDFVRQAAKHIFRNALQRRLGNRTLTTRRLFRARSLAPAEA